RDFHVTGVRTCALPISVRTVKPPSATLDLDSTDGLAAGDIAMVCNTSYSLIFQISGLNANGVLHNGGGSAPGNCGQEFQFENPRSEERRVGTESGTWGT